MRLYYVARTRATRPRWVLEELGVPYELVRLDARAGATRTPAHLARHPLGHVPVLEDGDTRLFESAAICLHLADRYPQAGLAPTPGTAARGLLYQWLFFCTTELEPHLSAISADRRKQEGQRDPAAVAAATAAFRAAVPALERPLGAGPWLLGDAFTVADVMAGALLLWAKALGVLPDAPAFEAYVQRVRERPAYQRATRD